MIWNDFGSRFYIWQGENKILSSLIVLVNPWFIPILFVLAGISARYALEKRSNKEFIMQRISKLVIPFISGMIFLVPFQTLYARKYFDNYEGSLLDNWKYFFTHVTDFSGYDGAFTPGHLWFILFLFFISMITLVLFHFLPYEKFIGSILSYIYFTSAHFGSVSILCRANKQYFIRTGALHWHWKFSTNGFSISFD